MRFQATRRNAALLIIALCLGATIYLAVLYRQLENAFTSVEEFIPTRIYSNVTQLSPGVTRKNTLTALTTLGYKPTEGSEGTLSFTLHEINYPAYLIPEDHPTLKLQKTPIKLVFDGHAPQSPLVQIETSLGEISDLYLEPSVVANLSRAESEQDKIRALIKFQDIPAPIWKAIIAIEDQHYLEHVGLDPRGFARAIWVNLKTFSLAQGGSTITQQLVKNLMVRRTKNIFLKISEIFLSFILEMRFSKEQILERYLNEVYLGQIGSLEVHGVAEGARHFFGKSLDQLNLGEIAMMAGLIRGPGFYSPYRYYDRAVKRQQLVLQKMAETGQIAQQEADSALKQPIRLAPPQTIANKAPYFTDFVKAELIRQLKDRLSEQEISSAGFRVYTTLDLRLNQLAQEAVARGVAQVEKQLKITEPDLLEGALASVDHTTGAIVALVGGKSYTRSTFNRILNMKRQVGSTFKPIVYLTALENGFGPASPVEDAPWRLIYDNGKQKWAPENYDPDHRGWISLREALAHSINTVAARLGFAVGLDKIIETARRLGVESDLPKVPSLVLGVAEFSPVELLNVYATLANRGVLDELTVIRGITTSDGGGYARFVYQPKLAYNPALADLMTDMLQSVLREGTGRSALALGFDRPAAGKTGTTSDHRDSWFAGYTPELTTVTWVGIEQGTTVDEKGKARIKLTGASSALPIWVDYMKHALEDTPPVPFPVSEHLTTVRIDKKSGKIASAGCPDEQVIIDKYMIGHEPQELGCEELWPPSEREAKKQNL